MLERDLLPNLKQFRGEDRRDYCPLKQLKPWLCHGSSNHQTSFNTEKARR